MAESRNCVEQLELYLSNLDRQPAKCYQASSGSQDDALTGWSPLAKAGGDWQLLESLARDDHGCAAAVGALVGLAIGDSLGAPLEFIRVNPRLDYPGEGRPCLWSQATSKELQYAHEYNKFKLKPGQWTDDSSMALCLADSLLVRGQYDGGDARVRWHMWWTHGYCNSFRHDRDREKRKSIGLGGNIADSLREVESLVLGSASVARHGDLAPAIYQSAREDAGNGSIMRLAPVPIAYHGDGRTALQVAARQSLATHPSSDASACCKFMAFATLQAIAAHKVGKAVNAQKFLTRVIPEFLEYPHDGGDSSGFHKLRALLQCAPPSESEQNWNWRMDVLAIDGAVDARRRSSPSGKYNGYHVSEGYFGSYCMDGLAMALWALWHSSDFMSCMIRAVNLLGDADTVAAIAGQLAGALYSWHGIVKDQYGQQCRDNLKKWDPAAEIGLRAACLYHFGPSSVGSRKIGVSAMLGEADKDETSVAPKHAAQIVTVQQSEGHPAVRLREQPLPDSRHIGELPNGSTAKVLEETGSWVFVEEITGRSQKGWIGRKNIANFTETIGMPSCLSKVPGAPLCDEGPVHGAGPSASRFPGPPLHTIPYGSHPGITDPADLDRNICASGAGMASRTAERRAEVAGASPNKLLAGAADRRAVVAGASPNKLLAGVSPNKPRIVALQQAEKHPSVRVFDRAQGTSRVVSEIGNGEKVYLLGHEGAFYKVQSLDRRVTGWVGCKNIPELQ